MHFPYLSFAKGYAIFTIMLFHVLQRMALEGMAQKAIVFGGTGVHLFFLLSGFGLALSKHNDTVWGFYKRRLAKVWFPYVIALSLSLGLAIGLDLFPDRWAAWLAGVSGWQMFVPAYIESFGGHYWFISTILQFYLVFPLLLWGYGRLKNPARFFALCMALSLGWWVMVFILDKGSIRTWNSFFLQFLWEFGLGMALAYAMKSNDARLLAVQTRYWQHAKWWIWAIGGVLGAAVMVVLILKTGRFGPVFNDVPALIGYGMLSVAVYLFSSRFLPPVRHFFEWMGAFSYSVYLVHIIVLELFLLMLGYTGAALSWVNVPLFIVLAIGAGWIYERWVVETIH